MEEKSSLTEYKPTRKRQAVQRVEQAEQKEKTTIKIAELVIKALVAIAALIQAIRWW